MTALLLALLILFTTVVPAVAGDVFVNGYVRRDGTYVPPHFRSAPDGNVHNNWSTYGNVNPYTGHQGTQQPNVFGGSGGVGNTTTNPWGTWGHGTTPQPRTRSGW